MKKISFKYHPNVWQQDVFSQAKGEKLPLCQCCGKETEYFLDHMYCKEEVECICPECVANGKAAEKFNGTFINSAEEDTITDREKIKELYCCTPPYVSWQGEHWLACCHDFCAFIDEVGTKELEEMGIADEVFAEYDARDEYEDAREYLERKGSMSGYLFRCLHCGKYHLWVDAE